jgi:hypothetical protein
MCKTTDHLDSIYDRSGKWDQLENALHLTLRSPHPLRVACTFSDRFLRWFTSGREEGVPVPNQCSSPEV